MSHLSLCDSEYPAQAHVAPNWETQGLNLVLEICVSKERGCSLRAPCVPWTEQHSQYPNQKAFPDQIQQTTHELGKGISQDGYSQQGSS